MFSETSLEPVNLSRGQVIDRAEFRIPHLYFITRGLISLVKTMRDGKTAEVGTVGTEGVTSPNAVFGKERAITEKVVQISGSALRISRNDLVRAMQNDVAVHDVMQRYTLFAYRQIVQTAACNGTHSMQERVCKWLLTCHDNAGSGTFEMTHQSIATALGFQRSGITVVLETLQAARLIRFTRGRIAIVDRAGLEHFACECYQETHERIEKLFPISSPTVPACAPGSTNRRLTNEDAHRLTGVTKG